MSIAKALGACIALIEEDLRRYQEAQKQDSKAFGVSEARSLKDYLQALATAYRAAGAIEMQPDIDLDGVSSEDIEKELLTRMEQDNAEV